MDTNRTKLWVDPSTHGQSRTESYSGGALGGVSVSVTSDVRRTNVTAQGSTWNKQATYAYDTGSGRLVEVSDVDNVVKYNYLAYSPLVQEVSYAKASNPSRILMSRRNICDALNHDEGADHGAAEVEGAVRTSKMRYNTR